MAIYLGHTIKKPYQATEEKYLFQIQTSNEQT